MADITVTPASVIADSPSGSALATAADAITAGQTIYADSATTVKLADDTTAVKAAACGIALNSAAIGQPVAYIRAGLLTPGAGTTLVVGKFYGVTDTPGGIGLLSDRGSGDFATQVGYAVTTAKLMVQIVATGLALA